MKKYDGMCVFDGDVVGLVGWGVRGRKRGDAKIFFSAGGACPTLVLLIVITTLNLITYRVRLFLLASVVEYLNTSRLTMAVLFAKEGSSVVTAECGRKKSPLGVVADFSETRFDISKLF